MSLKEQIEELLYSNANNITIAKAFKSDLEIYSKTLQASFTNSGGKDFLYKHTRKIDSIIGLVYLVACREVFGNYQPMKHAIPVAIVALGSYGREQLCVHSDIDLMIVYEEVQGYNITMLIEKILYLLWDIGLKLGHRVHKVSELNDVVSTDITIKTAIMESRFLDGSKQIWTHTLNAINQIRRTNSKEYISLKLTENSSLHEKYPLTMEPNIKEGQGGFRDANLVYWIGKVLYNVDNIKQLPAEIVSDDEYREFRIALEFLFRVRSALHIATGKKEDKLRLELIPDISKLLGYKDEYKYQVLFSKQVTTSLKTISLYSKIWIYKMTNKLVNNKNETNILSLPQTKNPTMNILFEYLMTNSNQEYKPHPMLLSLLAESKKTTSLQTVNNIKKLLYKTHSYSALNTLYEARILGNIITPLKKTENLPQFDGYHTYSVDEHSIKSILAFENMSDEFLISLNSELNSDEQAMLKLVILLHDAGKGRKKDHSIIGALLFKSYASKLGFDSELIKTGELLILNHTLMSKVAQREDLHDEQIITKFASRFGDKKTLDMLYLLTMADISAVGSGVLGSFTLRLLKTLYDNSLMALQNNELLSDTAKRLKKEELLKKSENFITLEPKIQTAILSIQSNLPFLRYKVDEIITLGKMAFGLDGEYTYKITNDDTLTIEIVRATSLQLGYLLGKLSHIEVVNMEICKLFNGLKYFKIEYNEKITDEDVELLDEIMQNSFNPQKTINLKKPEILTKEIEIDCDYSSAYASMKINTKNQKGLLAYIANLFDELGVDIESAKLHGTKNRTRDTFLIQKNGNFCHNTELILNKLTESI